MQALWEMRLSYFIIKSRNVIVGTTPLEEIAMLNYHTKFSTKLQKFDIHFFLRFGLVIAILVYLRLMITIPKLYFCILETFKTQHYKFNIDIEKCSF